jgi:PKHD-type hydroxylase
MKGEWCYFKSYFNKEFCEKTIRDALTIESFQSKVYLPDGTQESVSNLRRSTIRFLYPNDPRFADLFEFLWKTQIVANRDFFNVHVTKLDFIQFAEYSETDQGEYGTHDDVVWVNDNEHHRKLSCTISLSDPEDYSGGNFEFEGTCTQPLNSDLRLQGTVLYFPSFHKHKVTPVIRGKRYSIAAWFEGPKWR